MELTSNERLTLWRLAIAGGGLWLKEMQSPPSTSERKQLINQGLIDAVSKLDRRSGRRGIFLQLTEQGWNALDPDDIDGFNESRRGGVALAELLPALGQSLSAMNTSLPNLLRRDTESNENSEPETAEPEVAESEVAPPAEPVTSSPPPPTDVRRKPGPDLGPSNSALADAAILRLFLHSSRRKKSPVFKISELRSAVRLPEEDFHTALQRLVDQGELEIIPPDTTIGNRVEEATAEVRLDKSSRFLQKGL